MDVFIIKAVQLIVALAILIIIHEFGHFLFARIFGIKVEKFYIFFDPWTEIFKWKPGKYFGFFGKTKKIGSASSGPVADDKAAAVPAADNAPAAPTGPRTEEEPKGFWRHTEYGIGWIPLGGYCKIAGMIDESMDTEQMKKPAQKWEFRSKPAWQRLLVMIAGVLFNFLLAIIIYAGIVFASGEKYVPLDKATDGLLYSGEAKKAGFRDGDLPLTADGQPLGHPGEARLQMIQASNVKVLRQGDTVDIAIPKDLIFRLDEEAKSDTASFSFFTYRIPAQITQTTPGEGAANAGLKAGDRILAVDSSPTPDLYTFLQSLPGHDSQTVEVTVARADGARADTITVPVKLSDSSKMGIALEVDPSNFYPAEEKHYNLFQAVPRGIELGTDRLTSYAKSMKMVFTKEGAKSVGGFGSIGAIFPEKWDWIAFWNIAAFLSVALAFMNILPIPGLDGGHVLFLLYEVVMRRKPSDKFLEYAQMIGMGILILLLVYANGMDIVRLFK